MVDVNTQNKTISVNVSSSGVSSNVNASGDTTMYYSNKAKEWAISNRIVDGVDYSSKYYAGRANQSALNAQSFAQSAQDSYNNFQDSVTDSLNTIDNKVQEATDNIEIQKQDTITEIQDIATTQKEEIENLSEQEQSKIVDLGIDTRADIDLSNLSTTGQAKFDERAYANEVLKKNQITNCLLEVPQRIKLELNNGTVTLKAGSEVIVPNGFEADGVTKKFDYITVESDLTATNAENISMFVFYENGTLKLGNIAVSESGITPPSTAFYYNTATNKVSFYLQDVLTWDNGSLPVAIVKSDSNGIVSIDQIFNGFGYIGSTIWVDKGVKGLIPNGRNEDGTLKNIEKTTKVLRYYTNTAEANDMCMYLDFTTNALYNGYDFVISETQPSNSIIYSLWYQPSSNLIRYHNVQNTDWVVHDCLVVGSIDKGVNGVASNFQPKQPFRAVDYSDYASTPHIVETYGNNSSGYILYSNKYCVQWGRTVARQIALMRPFANGEYNVSAIVHHGSGDPGAYWCRVALTQASSFTLLMFLNNSVTSNSPLVLWKASGYVA